jgi:polysaccharide deacetylase family protein (PEP-CTERM system associated)
MHFQAHPHAVEDLQAKVSEFSMATNILTVDVEDYYQVSAFESIISRSSWSSYEQRVRKNTLKILDMFDEYKVKGTFFILGWVAEKDPSLIREIADRGHELACHGLLHRRIYEMSRMEFRNDVLRATAAIEDAGGRKIKGYRGASFSVTRETFWYLDILLELGFSFDSSIFPIRHDHYGIPDFIRFPSIVKTSSGGEIVEFPLSTIRFMGVNIPIAGGGYLRLLPIAFIRSGIRRLNREGGTPAIFYFHPWEVDPEQPRIKDATILASFRHYHNLDKTECRIRMLLKEFSFVPAGTWLEDNKAGLSYAR